MNTRRRSAGNPGCQASRLAFKLASDDLRLFFDCRCDRRWHDMPVALVAEARASRERLATDFETLGR